MIESLRPPARVKVWPRRSPSLSKPHFSATRAELIDAIASRYTERYMGTSITGESMDPPQELIDVHAEGCADGLLEGLRQLKTDPALLTWLRCGACLSVHMLSS